MAEELMLLKCIGWLEVENRFLLLLMFFIENVIKTKSPFIIYRNVSFSYHNFIITQQGMQLEVATVELTPLSYYSKINLHSFKKTT